MRELAGDLQWLDELLSRSMEQAGPFLRSSFEMPDHSLSARQMVKHLDGLPTISMASVTAAGEPRVAPIGAIFYRCRFHAPTVRNAARVRHYERRPALSATYYEGIDLAIIIHGRATIVDEDDPSFAPVDAELQRLTGESVLEWDSADGVYVRVDPDVIYTFARYPDQFPQ
ncbi:MAG: pyridoxamine 5'-phosphate oxidase family protein [Chloroflexota bacterium]